MIILDTSLLYALLDQREPRHDAAATWYATTHVELVTTPLVVGELDYLTRSRGGSAAQAGFRRDLDRGAYVVSWWSQAMTDSLRVADRYVDLGVSLTDGSLVALAARHATTDIATFDERHFRAMQPLAGGTSFRLLPADA